MHKKRIAAAVFLYFLDRNNALFLNGTKRLADATLVVLVSFWFLPILLLRDLAGELDGGFSYLAVICLALVTAPLPILLCLFNRFFDRK